MNNRAAFIGGINPCELNPELDLPAKLSDPFHGRATVERDWRGETLRVCKGCAKRIDSWLQAQAELAAERMAG